ncbi:MAG: putative bifunctional diguanylate cyclase/phosphodiesterase [Gammaproteobacteria bacterium]
MTIVGSYLRNLLAVLITVVGVMFVIQLIQLDRSSRALRDLGESSLNAQLDQQLASRADSIAQVVASNVAAPMVRFDMIGMYGVLVPAASRESVQEVLLLDLDGTVVHDGTQEVTRYGDAIYTIAPDVDIKSSVPQRLQREDSYAAVVPVFAGVEQIGQVYVALSRLEVATQLGLLHDRFNQIAQERRTANLRAMALGGIALTLIGMALSVIVARRMARPIEQLVAGTKEVARGNYDVSLEVQREDEVGELAAAFTNMSSELAMRNERISSLAFRDGLTGLANRAAFTEAVAQYLATGECDGAAVLFMDLDEFKRVNDTLGHEAGDAMLRVLGERLKDALVKRNFPDLSFEGAAIAPVARWGGDEFSLFLDGVDNVDAAMRVAQELLDELRQPVTIRGMEIVGGASIGVALYPSDSETIAALLGLADVAMYHAKERSDVRIAAYTPAMRESTEDRLALESDLREAIERGEFEMQYEPLFDPLSESLAGLEAHLVWRHSVHGVMVPESFMPLADSMDISAQIMEWMINRSLHDFATLNGVMNTDVELTIGLLSSQVKRERLIDALAVALENTALDSRRLILEISEQRLFRNVLHAVPFLTEVRRLGVQVWVDQFGSGYAAINRLRHMPLDGMKLDRSLVAEVDKSPADQSLSSAVIALAHSLGLRVGAMSVGNRAQLDFLRRSGCDVVQGSHFGLPADIDSFAQRISAPANRRA